MQEFVDANIPVLNFWDAMMIQAAAELGCEVLWTEDMKDEQFLRGVRVRNL